MGNDLTTTTTTDGGELVPEDDNGFAEIQAEIFTIAAEGRQPKSGQSATAGYTALRKLQAALADLGYDLDDVKTYADLDEHSRPIFPADVYTAFALQYAVTSNITDKGFPILLAHLNAGLRSEGWSVVHLDGRHDVGKRIREMTRPFAGPSQPRKPARPARADDVAKFFEALEAEPGNGGSGPANWSSLATQFERLSLSFWPTAVRPTQAKATIRHGWIDRDAEVLRVPHGGFKTTPDGGETIRIHHHADCDDDGCVPRCFFYEIAQTDKLCAEHGFPTGGDDFLFPAINNGSSNGLLGKQAWLANPIDVWTAEYVETGLPEGVAHGKAVQALSVNYRHRWKELVAAAGFEPRHKLETTGAHGMRRGAASDASDAGVPTLQISRQLGHTDIGMTGNYIEATVPDTSEIWAGEFDQLPDREIAELPGLGITPELVEWRATCEIEHDGDPCGNRTKAMTWLTLDGQQLRSCTAHSQRHREGKTGGDFTRPIGAQNLIASDAVCELRHHGVACGIRSPQMSRATIDGTDVIVCNLHYGRHRTGKTGDDFTRPSTEHRIPADATCEIKHNGEACGIRSPRMRRASIDGTDLIVCNSHWDRYATRGITGDDLIKPIKRRR